MAWSPFDKRGNLRLVLVTDPWWKRLWARLRRDGVWTQVGTCTEDESPPRNPDLPPVFAGYRGTRIIR